MKGFMENHPIFCYVICMTIFCAIVFAFIKWFWNYAPTEWRENFERAVGMLAGNIKSHSQWNSFLQYCFYMI